MQGYIPHLVRWCSHYLMPYWSHPLWIVECLLLLYPVLILHESGHYMMMRLYGVHVRRFTIGGSLWGLPTPRLRLQTSRGELVLGLLPTVARVDGDYENAPGHQRVIMYAAGGTVDFLVGMFILLLNGHYALGNQPLHVIGYLELIHGPCNLFPFAPDGLGILNVLRDKTTKPTQSLN